MTMLVVSVAISDEMPLPSTDAFFSAALRCGGSSGSWTEIVRKAL